MGEPVVTGYRSASFRHDCSIKGCYYETLPCWDEMNERFPHNIIPTDVDGMVEINDHILVLEEKRAGVGLKRGQRRAFEALSRRERVTVLFFRPVKDKPGLIEVLVYDGESEPLGFQPWTRDYFLDWVEAWAMRADLRAPADLRSSQ